jgi:hypothetical protein
MKGLDGRQGGGGGGGGRRRRRRRGGGVKCKVSRSIRLQHTLSGWRMYMIGYVEGVGC